MRLSDMDRNILQGLASGQTYRLIAAKLHVSSATVAYHVTQLRSRFHAPTVAAIVAIAFITGVLSNDTWPVQLTGLLDMDLPESEP